jgi:hypothetical protein
MLRETIMNRYWQVCFGITVAFAIATTSVVRAQSQAPAGTPATTPPTSAVPRSVPFNGQMLTAKGEARTGSALLTFGLYTDQKDGTPIWTEQQLVTFDGDGRYSVILGSVSAAGLPADAFAAGTPRWLGVQAEGDQEQPRFMLLSVPYALKAGDADTVAGKPASDFVLSSKLTDTVKDTLKSEGVLPKDRAAGSSAPLTTNFLWKDNGAGGDAASQVFDNGTNIGIGTTSPAALLELNKTTAGSTAIKIVNPTAATTNFSRLDVATDAAGGRGLYDAYSSTFTTSGNSVQSGVSFTALGAGGFSLALAHPTAPMRFYTGAGPSERMRIDSAGNIGIGTTSPTTSFELNRSTTGGTGVKVVNPTAGTSNYSRLDLVTDATGGRGLFDAYSSTFTTSGNSVQAGVSFTAIGAGGFSIALAHASAPIRFYTGAGPSERVRIDGSGNVGIGTTTPTQLLDVNGNVNVSGNIGAKYQDVAEWVETPEPLEPGTVVVVDPVEPNRVMASSKAYDTRVAGAVSKQPGLILGEQSDTKEMVAQSGRVRIKADAKYGAIKIGDLLVTSPTPGYAMRSRPIKVAGQALHRPGTLLGKALEALPNGKGEILVLLTLQ